MMEALRGGGGETEQVEGEALTGYPDEDWDRG